MITFDAKNEISMDKVVEFIDTQTFPREAIWSIPPDQAYALANVFYNVQIVYAKEAKTAPVQEKVFPDTLCGYPMDIQWEHTPGEMELISSDHKQTYLKVVNLLQPTI